MFRTDQRLRDLNYEPRNFKPIADSEMGKKLLCWLTREDTVLRMETACFLDRVAVEALSPHIVLEMGEWITETKSKQLAGHMVRAILEHLGYRHVKSGVTLYRGLFGQGARFETVTQSRNRGQRPSPQDRKEWVDELLTSRSRLRSPSENGDVKVACCGTRDLALPR